jgi:hypothetical protein
MLLSIYFVRITNNNQLSVCLDREMARREQIEAKSCGPTRTTKQDTAGEWKERGFLFG